MESLKPDEDQLAERGNTAGQRGKSRKAGSGQEGAGARVLWLMLVLVVVCVGAGGWLAWQQAQRIASLEQRVKAVRDDVRINQMELGVVDEQRAQSGQAVSEQLKMLDSEMRKLWVIAHQTNQPRIEALEKKVGTLESRVGELGSGQESQGGRLDELSGSVAELPDADELRASVEDQVQSLKADVDSRIQSLEQGRQLALEEVKARLDGLESSLAALEESESGNGEVGALRERMAELESVVDSIDSSRAQLTQRFVRLQQRVDRLASGEGS